MEVRLNEVMPIASTNTDYRVQKEYLHLVVNASSYLALFMLFLV